MRIGYWTTACFQPEIEAVSKEVSQLVGHFRGSFLFGVSPHYFLRASLTDRYIGFNTRFDPVLRTLIPVLERYCEINHVYGEAMPWTFYKALRSRPIVLTVASENGTPSSDFIARCRKVLVQTHAYYSKLRALGVEKEKVEILYPGVDLRRFRPRTDPPRQRVMPKILFASAPRSEEELNSRGVYLMLEAAKLNPEIQYRLLYREWSTGYTSLATTKKWLESYDIENVTLTNSVVGDMHRLYGEYDFTIIPYTKVNGGKECPMSALEGLACGLPTLISSCASFAEFVAEHECGVAFEPTASGLVKAIETGISQYDKLSANAVAAAARHFSLAQMLHRTRAIYDSILRR
jgi:glycosyltransferase involved in cell wall biosynthesis